MQKVYIRGWEPDVAPNDNRNLYQFCELAKDAWSWPARNVADSECDELNRGVAIPPGTHDVYNNFQIEEETPERFVIYCEIPSEVWEAAKAALTEEYKRPG